MVLDLTTAAEGRVDGEDAGTVTEALFNTAGLKRVQDFTLQETPAPEPAKPAAAPAAPQPGMGGAPARAPQQQRSNPARPVQGGAASEGDAVDATPLTDTDKE